MVYKIYADAFFTRFDQLLEHLVWVFPNDFELPAYRTGLGLLKKNPSLVVNTFKESVAVPFEKKIRVMDESFFINYDFQEHNAVADVISKCKTMWHQIDTDNKKKIWGYLIDLLDLATRL